MYATMKRDKEGAGAASERWIDLRSDTVTRPSEAMRAAMAEAEVGDDVYGEDPLVNQLEETVAELLGKEAGLFVSSGTQSNLIALLTHCQRGEEIIVGEDYHIYKDEAGGAAVLGGIVSCAIPCNQHGGVTLAQVKSAIKEDDIHYAISRLVCLENTVDGQIQSQKEIDDIAHYAHERGLLVHLDGARLMNAVVGSNCSVKQLVSSVDTVSLCLSKGLGAPVGSVLTGRKDFIHKARRNRKLVGGGMRQIGVLAACGLYALEHNVERMAEDHLRAKRLAEGLSHIPEVKLSDKRIDSSMVFFSYDKPKGKADLNQYLSEHKIIIGGGQNIRLVVHLDILDEDIDHIVSKISDYFFK